MFTKSLETSGQTAQVAAARGRGRAAAVDSSPAATRDSKPAGAADPHDEVVGGRETSSAVGVRPSAAASRAHVAKRGVGAAVAVALLGAGLMGAVALAPSKAEAQCLCYRPYVYVAPTPYYRPPAVIITPPAVVVTPPATSWYYGPPPEYVGPGAIPGYITPGYPGPETIPGYVTPMWWR